MANPQTDILWRKISENQAKVFEIAHKLESCGVLLERQGDENEGYTELHGLGIMLREMSERLFGVWRELDPGDLKKIGR